jgi:transcriptional regulator with XRE-family HTH domain
MDKYAKEFARALAASGVSSAEIAQAIGVDPSYISQCKTGRRPIPVDKARAIAALIHADPAAISKSYDELLQTLGTAPESRSQPMRLDLEIVRLVAQELQSVYQDEFKRDFIISAEPELFAEMYERTAERGEVDSRSNMIWLGSRIGKVPQGAPQDEQSKAIHGSRHDQGKAGPSG